VSGRAHAGREPSARSAGNQSSHTTPTTTASTPTVATTGGESATNLRSAPAATSTETSASSTAQTAEQLAIDSLWSAGIDTSKPPSYLVPIYKAAARRYGVPWTVLAAINAIETDYGHDVHTSSAGAVGWMQFMPSSWREYGVDATGDGRADPDNARDAIFAAGRLLAANGGGTHLRRAVFAYNHADWYVTEVLWLSQRIAGTQPSASAKTKLTSMLTTAHALEGLPYVYGGGHASWTLAGGYDCSGFVSTVLHAAGYLSAPQTTQTLPSQAEIARGPGRWVTIFDRTDASSTTEDHVILNINGQWWESGGSSTDGGSASVHRIRNMSQAYLDTFNLVLHPRGL
jgi:cell wall-associated NlpC family hydrolase